MSRKKQLKAKRKANSQKQVRSNSKPKTYATAVQSKEDEKRKKSWKKFFKDGRDIIITILIAILLLLLLRSCGGIWGNNTDGTQSGIGITTSPITDVQNTVVTGGKNKGDVVYASFPGYTTTYQLDKENQSIPLVNYATNEVNIVYEVVYNNEVILTTEEFTPGKGTEANFYNYFTKAGEYDVKLNAYSIIPETESSGYPVEFELHLVVTK